MHSVFEMKGSNGQIVKGNKWIVSEEVKQVVDNNETIQSILNGKNVVKEIYVKGKIYNIVVK